MPKAMFIFFVADQSSSREFYKEILTQEPVMDVPGMTEFALTEDVSFGLMTNNALPQLIQEPMPLPSEGTGIPRCELYLFVPEAAEALKCLTHAGGSALSKAQLRPWGDLVAYGADLDGHIIAFAQRT